MKKRYQIDREQAVRQFHKQAEESGQEPQLHLPLKEVAAALQQSVGELMRQAGLELMQLIMDNEVRQLAGEHYQRRQARAALPLGPRARLPRRRWTEGPHSAAAAAQRRRPRTIPGQLCVVPPLRAARRRRLGQAHARALDTELLESRAGVCRRLWHRKVSGE